MATNPTGLIGTGGIKPPKGVDAANGGGFVPPQTGGIKPPKDAVGTNMTYTQPATPPADGVSTPVTNDPNTQPTTPEAKPAFDMDEYMKTAAKYMPQAPTLASGGAASATAYNQELKDNEKTSSILNQLIDADSPYIQRAKAKAAEASNARGLMNSSIGVGAGVAAGIDAAAPIAQSDAALYENTRNKNQDAQNTTSQFNAGQSNQVMIADRANQAAIAKAQMEQQFNVMNQGFQQQFDLVKLDKQTQLTLSTMDKQQQLDLQKMATGFGYDIKKMDQQQVNDLAKATVLQSYDLTKMDKQAQIALGMLDASTIKDMEKMAKAQGFDLEKMSAQQINDLAKASVLQGYDLDKMDAQAALTLKQMDAAQINDLEKMAKAQGFNLDTMSAQQINDLAKMSAANQFDLGKMALAQGYTLETLKAATTEDLIKMAKAQGYDLEKMAKAQGFDIDKMDKQQLFDLAKLDKTFTQQEKEAQIKFGRDKVLLGMQQDSAKEIALIDNKYKALIQASASATSLSNNVSGHIQDILMSDLSAEAKADAIAQVQGNYENSLSLIGSLAGDLDMTEFFNGIFGPPTPTTPTDPADPDKPQTNLSLAQQESVNTFWAANKNDPESVMAAMTEFHIDAAGLAASTGQTLGEVYAYLRAAGAPPGFGGMPRTGVTPTVRTPPSSTQPGNTPVVGGPASGAPPPQTLPGGAPVPTNGGQRPNEVAPKPGTVPYSQANTTGAISNFWRQITSDPQYIVQEMLKKGMTAKDVHFTTRMPLDQVVAAMKQAGAPEILYSDTPIQPQGAAPVTPVDTTLDPTYGGGPTGLGGTVVGGGVQNNSLDTTGMGMDERTGLPVGGPSNQGMTYTQPGTPQPGLIGGIRPPRPGVGTGLVNPNGQSMPWNMNPNNGMQYQQPGLIGTGGIRPAIDPRLAGTGGIRP